MLTLGIGIGPPFGGVNNTPYSVFGSALKVWHDNQDLTTLFSDFVGTAASVGSRVALQFDKSLMGGMSVSAWIAAQTQMITNGTFDTDTTGWTFQAGNSTATVSSGGVTVLNGIAAVNYFYQAITTVVGQLYLATGEITAATASSYRFRKADNNTATANVVDIGTAATTGSKYRVFVATATTTYIIMQVNGAGVGATFDNISVKALPGYHRYQATTASQPYLRQNATTGAYYLECDGSDDGMVTPSLDLSATDKVAVFTAARKIGTTNGALLENSATSASNDGTFAVFSPNGSGATDIAFRSRGTTIQDTIASGYTSPITNVLTGIGDISGDSGILRINGAQAASNSGDQGTGNYGNYALYYFRRGGSSLPFNGYEYGNMIVAGAVNAGQIAFAETLYNRLSGAY